MLYNPSFGSHIPLLLKVMSISTGNVLECGAGFYSTPILHWLCLEQGKDLYTYEGDWEWYCNFKRFRHSHHRVRWVENNEWRNVKLRLTNGKKWGVAFLDQNPHNARRKIAIKLANICDFVIIHDSDPFTEKLYFYRSDKIGCFKHFKYIYEHTKYNPHTTVMSNFYDVKSLFS
jgi:hypothetical protein